MGRLLIDHGCKTIDHQLLTKAVLRIGFGVQTNEIMAIEHWFTGGWATASS